LWLRQLMIDLLRMKINASYKYVILKPDVYLRYCFMIENENQNIP
jgi:hypothetical protein